jgi:hypothetical protein
MASTKTQAPPPLTLLVALAAARRIVKLIPYIVGLLLVEVDTSLGSQWRCVECHFSYFKDGQPNHAENCRIGNFLRDGGLLGEFCDGDALAYITPGIGIDALLGPDLRGLPAEVETDTLAINGEPELTHFERAEQLLTTNPFPLTGGGRIVEVPDATQAKLSVELDEAFMRSRQKQVADTEPTDETKGKSAR